MVNPWAADRMVIVSRSKDIALRSKDIALRSQTFKNKKTRVSIKMIINQLTN